MKVLVYVEGPSDRRILESDVSVAKNYLSEAHVQELNRIVSAYLDLAETRTQRGTLMKMEDSATFLNQFLELSSYPILADKGRVSALEAKLKAKASTRSTGRSRMPSISPTSIVSSKSPSVSRAPTSPRR